MKLIPYFGNLLPKSLKNFLKEKLKILDIYIFFRKILHILFLRLIRIKRFYSQPKKYVNIGCGLSPSLGEQWLNADRFYGDIYIDVKKRLPFNDNSLDVVFHEHLIEHIPYENALFFCKETFRSLKSGGVVRFATPDFGAYVKGYIKKDLITGPVEKGENLETKQMDVINLIFKQNGEHEYIYDYQTIKKMLENVGFINIKHCEPNHSRLPCWKYDHWVDDKLTMYIEADKH